METGTTVEMLQVVSTAVTPVVLISAAAAHILGINQKHAALADRLRALSAEFRAPATPEMRRRIIQIEVQLFAKRFAYASFAHRALYTAVVCFVAMVLVLALTPRATAWEPFALGLFVGGVALILIAVCAELLEIRLAGRTVTLEIRDVLAAIDQGLPVPPPC